MNFQIRRAVTTDALEIVQSRVKAVHEKAKNFYSSDILHAWAPPASQSSVDKMIAQIENDTWLTLVAEGEAILGFGEICPSQNRLGAMYVRKNEYGRVGTALLDQLLDHAREKNAPYLEMEASLNAENFYRRAGFQVVEDIKRPIGAYIMDCVKMRINL